MTAPRFIDPNSGAAPQPGGAVVGGEHSQTGEAHEKLVEALTAAAPTSNQEAEIQRQALVGLEQEDAKQGEEGASEPGEAPTPDLAEPADPAPAKAEAEGDSASKAPAKKK